MLCAVGLPDLGRRPHFSKRFIPYRATNNVLTVTLALPSGQGVCVYVYVHM